MADTTDVALQLSTLAQALNATSLPMLGPPQLEIANVAITLPSDVLDSKQVIYVDVRCGDSLFRTTAQARKFDPLAAHRPPQLAFESDRGHLSVPMPIASDTELLFSVRRCQIFGDSDLCAVVVPIAALPLIKHTPRTFTAGCFTFQVLPINLGFDPDPSNPPQQPSPPITVGVRQMNYFESQEAIKRQSSKSSSKKTRDSSSPGIRLPKQQECEPMPALAHTQQLSPRDPTSTSPPSAAAPPPPPPPQQQQQQQQQQSSAALASSSPAPKSHLAPTVTPPRQQPGSNNTSPSTAGSPAATQLPPGGSTSAEKSAAPALSEDDDGDGHPAARPRAFFPDTAQSALDAFGAPPATPAYTSGQPQPLLGVIPGQPSQPVTLPQNTTTGWGDGPLQVIRNEEQLKPLMYRGAVPPTVAPLPAAYQRTNRLKQLLKPPVSQGAEARASSGGLGALFGSLANAMVSAAGELSNTVDVELMRSSFPDIRSPLVNTFTPHVLNGHGTPIPGKLYVTTTDVAFDGPLLTFHYPFSAICYIRRTTAFGKDCIQLFCPGQVAYQLQDFDGMVARLGNVTGVRDHTSFFNGYCTLLDLWRVSRGLPPSP